MTLVTSFQMDDSVKILAEIFHLSQYEARLYAASLGFQEAMLTDLAKRAGIPRTAAYPPLQSLMKRGFFTAIKIKKRTYYRALDPKNLTHIYDQNRLLLNGIVQELVRTIAVPDNGLSVQYFAGKEGILAATEIFLKESKSKLWRTFENPLRTAGLTGTLRIDAYIKQRLALGIFCRVIVPANALSPWVKEKIKDDKKELRQTVVVSPELYPIEANIAINSDMIQIIMTHENVFSVLIKNKTLAKTLTSIHEMIWDRYTDIH